jgi:tetratricopeptide (TPR) repeat protein
LLASLNIQRDLISREINCPLLFWVSNFALTVIAREAPDFYDFRHTVFNLKSAQDSQPLMSRDTIPRDHTTLFDQVGRSERRTTFLLQQLERYQKDESRIEPRDRMAYGELLEEVARSYRDERHRTEALIYLEQALKIYSELQEKGREAAVLQAIADIYYFADNHAKATESLAKALPLHREIGDRLGEANALQSLGDVKRMQDAYGEAEQLYQQALLLYREIGARLGEATALQSLGHVKLAQSAYGEAEQLYLRALEIYSSIEDKYSQGVTLLSLARVYHALGDGQRAKASADQAQELLAAFPQMAEARERLLQEFS